MELLISLFLTNHRYSSIEFIPSKSRSLEFFKHFFGIRQKELYSDILNRFFPMLDKIAKHQAIRLNQTFFKNLELVNPYLPSKIAAFFALDRLKIKLLFIKKMVNKLQQNQYNLSLFPKYHFLQEKTFDNLLFSEFHIRSRKYLQLIFSKIPKNDENRNIFVPKCDTQKFFDIGLHICKNRPNYSMNYIMRSIESSLFICNLIFNQMNIENPFYHKESKFIDVNTTLIDPHFIPYFITNISDGIKDNDHNIVYAHTITFNFLMTSILTGINNAFKKLSNNQISLRNESSLYSVGDLLEF